MSTALSCGVLIEFGNLSLGHLPELVGGSSVGTACSLRLLLPPVSSALSSSLCSLQDWRFFARVWAGGAFSSCKLGSEGFECVLISTV